MVVACKCRVACCQVLDSAVLAFKLDKCWKEAGFRPILDGQQVGLRLLLCYTEHWLLGKATWCHKEYALKSVSLKH